jgi:hypothetical protein
MLRFAFEFLKEFEGASLCIPPFAHVYPLVWWWTHGGLFSNVGFFAKQFVGIPKFQIEVKRMFNMFSVLATMWHCCLQVEIFDWIINMVKINLMVYI